MFEIAYLLLVFVQRAGIRTQCALLRLSVNGLGRPKIDHRMRNEEQRSAHLQHLQIRDTPVL